MTHPKEELDDASYMKLMYMKDFAMRSREIKNAARYCYHAMYAIQECMQSPEKNAPVFWTCRDMHAVMQ